MLSRFTFLLFFAQDRSNFIVFSGISRADQDAFAIGSYEKSKAAVEGGIFDAELCPVTIPGKRGKPDVVVNVDEEFNKVNFRLA